MYYLLSAATLYTLGLSENKVVRIASLAAGLLVHGTFIALRTMEMRHPPVTARMDILSLISFLMVVVLIYLNRMEATRRADTVMLPLAALFALTAMFHEPLNTMDVFMKSPWFYLYSSLNVLTYVVLGAATALGIMYLTGEDEAMERLQHRFTIYGWAAFSLSLLAGSVWFFLAYGSFWYWTAREFWLSMAWMYYGGLYLHFRYLPSLRGRPAAFLGVLGYPLLLFNFFGIGTLIQSPWSQF